MNKSVVEQNPIQLYFMHGWACDSSIWHKWLNFVDKAIPCQIFDRGYFDNDKQNIYLEKTDAKNIVITHSLGIHFLAPEFFEAIDLLVLISGFRYFHEESLHGKTSAKRTNLMKQRLLKDPIGLLQDFYIKCGLNSLNYPHPSHINNQLLYDDLLFLDNHEIELERLQQIPTILLLHGDNDQIVSSEHSQLMHKLLPNSQLFIHEDAEHALPISEAGWCMQIIDDKKKNLDKKIFYSKAHSNAASYSDISSNFAKQSQSYNQTARAQKFAADRLANRITSQITNSSPGNVLEVGCGSGLLSKHLIDIFPEHTIYFLDPAQDMVALCRKQFPEKTALQFVHSTIEDYFIDSDFSQNEYKSIVSSFVLHWLFDLKLVLGQLLKKLAPAGKLFFSVPVAGSFSQWQNICTQLNIPFTGNVLPRAEDIKSAINDGQGILEYEEYTYNIEFQNSLQFFQHMKLLGANTRKFMPVSNLTVTDFRHLLRVWDSQSIQSLGKGDDKIICTYKIMEGTVTTR